VSIGTDDPLMFGPFTVAETCDMLTSTPGLGGDWRLQLTRNGIESAFVTDERRRWLRERLEAAVDSSR